MCLLSHDCKWSGFHVYPPNWKTTEDKRSLNGDADCNVIDSLHLDKYPNAKSIRLKQGVSRIKIPAEKQACIKKIIKKMIVQFLEGYNSITDILLQNSEGTGKNDAFSEVFPSNPFITAFRIALENSTNVKECIKDIRSVVNSVEVAATTLCLLNIPIGEIEVIHVKRCLDLCYRSNPKFSAKRYNKAKA